MSATAGRSGEPASTELVEELHDLEAQEAALERRTRSLEIGGPLTLLFSVLALALSIGAFAVALTHKSDGNQSGFVTPAGMGQAGMMGGTAGSGMMAGAGGHGRFSAATVAAGAKGNVAVQLGDYWVAPSVPSVRAGKVTFVATNVGKVPHELMLERMPIKMDAPMRPNEDAAQGMIDDMDPGKTGTMSMKLAPGTYMLFCNVTGHYAAGQHTVFRVTAS